MFTFYLIAVDPKEKQFKHNPEKSDRVRVWVG